MFRTDVHRVQHVGCNVIDSSPFQSIDLLLLIATDSFHQNYANLPNTTILYHTERTET